MELRNFIEDLLWGTHEVTDEFMCMDFSRVARKRRYVKGAKGNTGKPMIDRMVSKNPDVDMLVYNNSIV